MEQMTEWEMTLAARKDARAAAALVHSSPWLLALSISLAWALLVFGTLAAYLAGGLLVGGFVGGLLAPFPLFVTAWALRAWRVELGKLDLVRGLLGLPDIPAREEPPESDESTEPAAQLRAGVEVNGKIVSPVVDASPAAVALRGKCLTFVRAGLRRGGWSRSKIAEGPNKLMSGDDWSDASKELQRLNFFGTGSAGMEPRGDVADIIKRLEAAK